MRGARSGLWKEARPLPALVPSHQTPLRAGDLVWLAASALTDWSDRGCLISLWKCVYLKVRVSGGVNTDAVSDIRSTESPGSWHLCFPIK